MGGERNTAQEGVEKNTAVATVVLGLPNWSNLRQGAVDDGESGRHFAVVQLGSDHREIPFYRNILQQEFRAAFAWCKFRGRTHNQPVAMGVLQPLVHPILGVGRQVVLIQLPGCHQYLPHLAVHGVTVPIDIEEIIVKLHELELIVCVFQRLQVPEPYILQNVSAVAHRSGGKFGIGLESLLLDLVQGICPAGSLYIALDIDLLQFKLVRFDLESLKGHRVSEARQ